MYQSLPIDLDPALVTKLASIQMLALDVDGILTDGSVTYDSNGAEHKSFNIKDGLGIKLAQQAGIKVAIITGRVSPMVERRANELHIDYLIQGREDKGTALTELEEKSGISLKNIAYMGDDLPDYLAIRMAGIGITVADGHADVQAIADWITANAGGQGAVREVCDALLVSHDQYQQMTASFK